MKKIQEEVTSLEVPSGVIPRAVSEGTECLRASSSFTPALEPDRTRPIEDMGLKEGRIIPAPVMGGFRDLHTKGLLHLNRLFYGSTCTSKYGKNKYSRQMLNADVTAGGNEL